jgi:peptide/nickel transport system permease protein
MSTEASTLLIKETKRSDRLRRNPGTLPLIIGGTLTLLMVATGITSRFYTPDDVNAIAPVYRLLGLGAPGHPLGTDALGRDVLSEVMAGVWTSLYVSVISALIALVVGGLVGLLAATRHGWIDELLMRGVDILLAIPGIVLALVLVTTIGGGTVATVTALAAFFSPAIARVTRSSAISVLEENFVVAARLYGRGRIFIALRHVLPAIRSVMIVQFTVYLAVGVLTEAALSYLGAGVQRPSVSLGLLINEAQSQVGVGSTLVLWPGLAIAILVLGLNLLGDGLRDLLDPRLRSRER